jgi:hypothetical protein
MPCFCRAFFYRQFYTNLPFCNFNFHMPVTLTIIRYKKTLIPFAFFAMAIHRLPLWLNKGISFYKLMGSGKNGTFDKIPDLQQWAILTVQDNIHIESSENILKELYGSFIDGWYQFFKCETFTLLLDPIEGHGTWDSKKVFGDLPAKTAYEGKIAVLTRATIRVKKLKYFWANVAPVASMMSTAPGFLFSAGIGEVPWIKQATFSIWESKLDMKNFAYGTNAHASVIQKTRTEKWYSEDMFTRFKIISTHGTLRNKSSLQIIR